MSNILPCDKQKKYFNEEELAMELDDVKKNIDNDSINVIDMLLDGFNKTEIIKKMDINSNKFNLIVEKLSKNRMLKEILTK